MNQSERLNLKDREGEVMSSHVLPNELDVPAHRVWHKDSSSPVARGSGRELVSHDGDLDCKRVFIVVTFACFKICCFCSSSTGLLLL